MPWPASLSGPPGALLVPEGQQYTVMPGSSGEVGSNGGLPASAPASWPPTGPIPPPAPRHGPRGSISACPEEGGLSGAFPLTPSWLPIPAPPPWPEGLPCFPENGHSSLADPHPTLNKAQMVSTPTSPLLGRSRLDSRGPSRPWPASVAMATQSLAVGTVGLLGVLSLSVGGRGR